MSSSDQSIIKTIIRSFVRGLFTVVGAIFGFVMLVAVLAGVGEVATKSTAEVNSYFTAQVLPGADGKRAKLEENSPILLEINIEGFIGSEFLNTRQMHQLLTESHEGALEGNRVRGVLLRINSPGGTIFDSDGIYRAIKNYKEQWNVPVVAYIDGLCASGGMYIASAADEIYASDSSLIGSVGVVMGSFVNFSELLDKLGVKAETLTAGTDKDLYNPLRPWREDEGESIKQIVSFYYDQFVHIVASARPELSKEALMQQYGARIFPAPLAAEYGFIDLANYSKADALKELANASGVEEEEYQVVQLASRPWFGELFMKSPLATGTINHQVQIPGALDPELQGQFLYLYRPN